MNAEPVQPGRPEGDLTAAQGRIRELEEQLCEADQELKAASEIIDEQDFNIECLRLQLATADLMLDEAAAARRKLERRIADLEDSEQDDDPCPVIVPVPQEQAPPHPSGCTPNSGVESMIARFQPREKQ